MIVESFKYSFYLVELEQFAQLRKEVYHRVISIRG